MNIVQKLKTFCHKPITSLYVGILLGILTVVFTELLHKYYSTDSKSIGIGLILGYMYNILWDAVFFKKREWKDKYAS